jgi:hypothetical protein
MLCVASLILSALAAAPGCSRAPSTDVTANAPQDDSLALYSKHFDAKSLVELKDDHGLPTALRDYLGQYPPSVVGLSKTSALMAYQVDDYVPTYAAAAFVFRGSRWIRVKTWDLPMQPPSTLPQLLQLIMNVENPTTALDLEATLSQLNLADPVADLNRNLAKDKTYFVGICEPPGRTPGVPPADEDLVHSSAHGLWCLPGSGDPIKSEKYAHAIDQARSYSSRYNAELLSRIRNGTVP